MIYVIVFITQILYTFIRLVTISSINESLKYRIGVSIVANLIWLVTVSLGVGALLKGDYYVFIPYMLASIVGTVIEDLYRKKEE